MKLGISTYCFWQEMSKGQLDILDAVELIARMGGEHVEVVPMGYDFTKTPELLPVFKRRASDAGIDISNYAIGANFSGLDDEAYLLEIERVKREVDIAAQLGVTLMRHDVAYSNDISIRQFLMELPRLAEACRAIADYAAPLGITTSVENHGFYVQASDRVQALVNEVNRDNFKTTLDIGNFVCVDEEPIVAVAKNLPFASIVHVKDFYRRSFNPGEGWFQSAGGQYLRGAITGQGDIDIRTILKHLKQSGYNGYLSLEFEGMEPCVQATQISLDNVRNIWSEV
ncbi:MAG: sugar phosphate isomerase/epimerase [Candidatus Cohnella colombiensis]|uniref:Sugar phosphate isomerase/epimerase n=1 Tax=Candidatus Cohnella colombiensis TaxID=3121368 RepID=A0AA95EXE9_9BACL|nr:MAG: sugar phosphate isomerase/epimerase [Cohnella sp.]